MTRKNAQLNRDLVQPVGALWSEMEFEAVSETRRLFQWKSLPPWNPPRQFSTLQPERRQNARQKPDGAGNLNFFGFQTAASPDIKTGRLPKAKPLYEE
ncbi:MAG: hypothetical protein LBO66_11650 [Deltaproteobacteria bacterium]|nr:hypothetical protein [Deltaproteobacteria bacterium]